MECRRLPQRGAIAAILALLVVGAAAAEPAFSGRRTDHLAALQAAAPSAVSENADRLALDLSAYSGRRTDHLGYLQPALDEQTRLTAERTVGAEPIFPGRFSDHREQRTQG